jgi:hypothetical protein
MIQVVGVAGENAADLVRDQFQGLLLTSQSTDRFEPSRKNCR